jgi:hypothetical protein
MFLGHLVLGDIYQSSPEIVACGLRIVVWFLTSGRWTVTAAVAMSHSSCFLPSFLPTDQPASWYAQME